MASACAGLSLGLAELLLSASVAWLPPPLAAVLLASCVLLVMACGGLLWLATRLRRLRYTQAALVGAMLGPLFAVGASGPVRLAVGRPWSGLVAGLVGGILLVGVGPAAARMASRRERIRPPSPTLTWAGASLLLSGLGRSLQGGANWAAQAAIPLGIALAAAGLLGLAPRRSATPWGGSSRLLLTLLVAAAIVPFWPWLFPWLLYDENLPGVGPWPPNLLFVGLEAHGESQEGLLEKGLIPTLELISVAAVSYQRLGSEAGLVSLLRLPDGSALAPQLRATGYATAAILSVPDRALGSETGAEQTDDRPGGRRTLEQSAAWMAGAPLLLARGAGLLSLLGQDRALRSPEQVAEDAAHWLLAWRTTRAPAPFFLLVDFRAPDTRAEAIDTGLQILLDRLEELELDAVTILVVALEGSPSSASNRTLRALVAPPFSWSHATRLEVARPTWGSELALALLRIARSDGETPVSLPGLTQPLIPPKPPPAVKPGADGT